MVSERPDGLVCDLDGVLYRGTEPIPGSVATIERLRRAGVRILFCSNNSSLTVAGYRDKLGTLGIEADASEVLTSAVVLGTVLKDRVAQPADVLCIGGDGMREAIEQAGHRVVANPDADVVAVGWDLAFNYDRMRMAALALTAGALFFASNSDASFPAAGAIWPGAGAILASIETASARSAVVLGKPHEPTARLAAERLAGCQRIAVVGDRLDTDIALGAALGWDTVLVLSGVTQSQQLAASDLVPGEVAATLSDVSWAQ